MFVIDHTIFGIDHKMCGKDRKILGIDRTMFGIDPEIFGGRRKLPGFVARTKADRNYKEVEGRGELCTGD